MLMAFFNIFGKMVQTVGPRNEILSDPGIQCPHWRYSELRVTC